MTLKGVGEMLQEVQEVKVGGRTRRVHVRPFAWNLHAPTHMEWTPDGRLLISKHTGDTIRDTTDNSITHDLSQVQFNSKGKKRKEKNP